MKLAMLLFAVVLCGCTQTRVANRTEAARPVQPVAVQVLASPAVSMGDRSEQIRTECINGRRRICGRVLQVAPDGLVVDSGYTNLFSPPLSLSWVADANISVSRDPNAIEENVPSAVCIGLVFLTDIPKRPAVKRYDYVAIQGYPAGQYSYVPAPNVQKTIRKFSAGLDTAVRLNLQAGQK